MTTWQGVRSELRCAAAEATWRVELVRLTERLDAPYRATVGLTSASVGADPDELLGQRATVTFERDAFVRQVHGIVIEVRSESAADGDRTACAIVLVPALDLARLTLDTRIFQHETAPAIVEELLAPLLARDDRALRLALQRAQYPEREYTAQYEESALDFAQRLLEDEGIAYWFEATDEAEVLVLTDANRSFAELDSTRGATLHYEPRASAADVLDVEHVSHLERTSRLRPTSVVVSDFDWTSPSSPPRAEERGDDPVGRDHERYEHRSPGTIGGYDPRARTYQAHDHSEQARLRLEAATRDRRVVSGRGTVCGLAAGARCELVGHPTLNGAYVVTAVTHELVVGDGAERAGSYGNTFEAQPMDVPYRPARVTRRPRVEMETATVVGSGERGHLHLDEHGRVKVQFHWDRVGERNERSSCWLRVAQAWAGSGGWGSHFLPRIGDEVVVTYVRGDPDRPIVTGHLFNGDNPSHTETPARQTQSGIVTRSLGQGEGHNALLFDDDPAHEAIDVHAQRDLREIVRHDHTTTVTNDQTNTVGGNQAETVSGDQALTVEQNRTHTVEKSETVEIREDRQTTVRQNDETLVEQDQALTVQGNRTVTVEGTQQTSITQAAAETYSATHTVEVTEGERVTVHGDRELVVDGTFTIRVGAGCTLTMTPDGQVTLVASQEILAQVGERTELRLQPEQVQAIAQILALAADATATLSGAEKNAVVLGDGEARVNGQSAVQLQAEHGGNVTANAGGVTHTGQTVSSQGTLSVEAASPLVKLN